MDGSTLDNVAVINEDNDCPEIISTATDERCTPGILNLSATTDASGAPGTFSWFAVPTGGTVLGTNATFTTPVITVSTTYYVSVTEGSCTSARTAVIATINSSPSPGTATNTSSCNLASSGSTTIDLDDQLVGADPGNWVLTTSPDIGSVTIDADNVVDFVGKVDGNYVFTYMTTATAPCTTSSVELTISVSNCLGPCDLLDAPTITSIPTLFCDTISQDLDAYVTGTTPPSTTLTWSTNADALVVANHLTVTTVNSPGIYYGFYYNTAEACASPVLEIELTLNNTPTIDSTTPANRCGSGDISIVATSSTGTINWYQNASGGVCFGHGGYLCYF